MTIQFKSKPKHMDVRLTIRKFLWFPKIIKKQFKWLEYAGYTECYYGSNWYALNWIGLEQGIDNNYKSPITGKRMPSKVYSSDDNIDDNPVVYRKVPTNPVNQPSVVDVAVVSAIVALDDWLP